MKVEGGPAPHSEDLSLVPMSTVFVKTNSPGARSLKWAGNDPTSFSGSSFPRRGKEKSRGRGLACSKKMGMFD